MKAPPAPSIRSHLAFVLLPMLCYPSLANLPGAEAQREFALVVQLKADAVHGQRLFDTCAACHGRNGAGVSDGTVPGIAGQHFRVVVWQLVNFRHGQRLDSRMQHFTDRQHLNGGTQDIADVAAYVSHLRPAASTSTATGNDTVHGADIYKANCSSCHGPSAQGDDQQRIPRLAGQHYEYLLHRWQDAVQGQHADTLSHRLTSRDLGAICEYLSRLGPQPASPPESTNDDS